MRRFVSLRPTFSSLGTKKVLGTAYRGTSTRHVHLTSTCALNRSRQANSLSDVASLHDHTLIPSPAERDTIFALSTPPGKGAVAVIRISGPRSRELHSKLLRPKARTALGVLDHPATRPWKLGRYQVVDPGTDEVLDDALAVFFRGKCVLCACCTRISNTFTHTLAPRSFTTEDSLELHVHSSRAVVAAVLRVLSTQPGCRPAEPGEFTRRALMAGRIDLTQAEGLADLIDAETEAQRKGATRVAEVRLDMHMHHSRFNHLI